MKLNETQNNSSKKTPKIVNKQYTNFSYEYISL